VFVVVTDNRLIGTWESRSTQVKYSISTRLVYYFFENGIWIWKMLDWIQKDNLVSLIYETANNQIRWIRIENSARITSSWMPYFVSPDNNSMMLERDSKKTWFQKIAPERFPLPEDILAKIKKGEISKNGVLRL